jgi:hypothetical protein
MRLASLLPLVLAFAAPLAACGGDAPWSTPTDAGDDAEAEPDTSFDAGDESGDGGPDAADDATCADPDCSGRGTCEESADGPACSCETGYDGDDCGRCAAGYQDHDGDGTCSPDCATAARACGLHALCDDSDGTAACVCESAWQDHDGDGTCEPACVVAGLACGLREVCDDVSGTAACVCDWGWTGEGCAACAPGFTLAGGECLPDHEWAVLVYMAADGTLEPFARADLEELVDVGSSDAVHLVVLIDPYAGPSQVLYLEPGAAVVVSETDESDTGDGDTLRDFGMWATAAYPAKRTALVVWNHGNGWKGRTGSVVTRSIGMDAHGDADGISIAGGELGEALEGIVRARGGRPLDLLGFDACLMGMWEVAAAVAPYAGLMVASSANEPPDGWPYLAPLRALRSAPTSTPDDLAASLVEAYAAESTLHFTLAATDLGALGDVTVAVDGLAASLLAHRETFALIESTRLSAQGFEDPDVRDLWDFAERLAASPALPVEVGSAANLVVRALRAAIVESQHQSSHPGAHGLSIYLPGLGAGMVPRYAAPIVPWSMTRWGDFLLGFTAE